MIEQNFDFVAALRAHGAGALTRRVPTTLQVNVGKLCNQACHHCHVEAGPKRTERMTREVAEQVIRALAASPGILAVDITGGAPELNENFRFIVESSRALGRRVIVRCNLTVIFAPAMEWLPEFYRINQVELVCSLPCYTAENVTRQRGAGVFEKSIAAMRILNRLGYGIPETGLLLDLVYNPVGAFLPPEQGKLEEDYRRELRGKFRVEFRRLLTITNMPIKRFADSLRRDDNQTAYMSLLVNHFNPATVDSLMCRDLVSVGYDGALYDCDFNQMLELRLGANRQLTIFDFGDLATLAGQPIASGSHCFGCTAGAGSSCSGAIA